MAITDMRTVTEPRRESNHSDESGSSWKDPFESCHFIWTGHQNGKFVQQWKPCRGLHCPQCGPYKRQRELERATQLTAEECGLGNMVYAVEVPIEEVDRIRKRAARQDAPTMSVPVGPDRNVVLSTFDMAGGHHHCPPGEIVSVEFLRRLFIERRINKRQVTTTGRWFTKDQPATRRPENRAVTLSKKFVGKEAFEIVAKRLGARLSYGRDLWWFDDPGKVEVETVKEWLVETERELRRNRRKEHKKRLGWAWGLENPLAT